MTNTSPADVSATAAIDNYIAEAQRRKLAWASAHKRRAEERGLTYQEGWSALHQLCTSLHASMNARGCERERLMRHADLALADAQDGARRDARRQRNNEDAWRQFAELDHTDAKPLKFAIGEPIALRNSVGCWHSNSDELVRQARRVLAKAPGLPPEGF